MDAEFAQIIPALGAPSHVRPVPPERIVAYRGRVPDGLLEFWQEVGFCSFLDGYVWVCDPDDFTGVLDAVFLGDRVFQKHDFAVFMYDAFGHLTGWRNETRLMSLNLTDDLQTFNVQSTDIRPNTGETWSDPRYVANAITRMKQRRALFTQRNTEDFEPALRRLGPLGEGEIYAYVPALSMGGSGEEDTIQKAKLREHLLFLAQLADVVQQRYILDTSDPSHPMGRHEDVRIIGPGSPR